MARISIAGLLGFVVAFGLGFAALVNASDLWRGAAITLTLAVLLGSLVGIILRGWRGGGWSGFALFGWGYFLAGLTPVGLGDHLRELSDPPTRWAFDSSNLPPAPPTGTPPPPGVGPGSRSSNDPAAEHRLASAAFRGRRANAGLIGHWLAALLFAMVGALLGILLARTRPTNPVSPTPA